MESAKVLEKFVRHGDKGETIPEDWTLEKRLTKYPYVVNVIRVSWLCDSKEIEREIGGDYLSPTVLPDRTGVLLIQPSDRHGSNNAIIVNADGTLRFRLKNPFPANPYYHAGVQYEFFSAKSEGDRFGLVVAASSKSKGGSGWVNVEWFYELDTRTGRFLSHHVTD